MKKRYEITIRVILYPLLGVLLFVGVLEAWRIFFPMSHPFIAYRSDTAEALCENNIRLIQHAKGVWTIKNEKKTGDSVEEERIYEFINGGRPVCPKKGIYSINKVGEFASCSIHSKPQQKATK